MKTVYTMGWNIPGYLPDMEVENHETFDHARKSMLLELEYAYRDNVGPDSADPGYVDAAHALDLTDKQEFTHNIGAYVWWIQPFVVDDDFLTYQQLYGD